jgi:hypothetical protein
MENQTAKWRISTSGVFGPDPAIGNCNCSWTQGPWSYAIVKFTNTRRFEWWGELMEHHGMVNIYFDESGWEERTGRRTLVADNLDTYSPDNLSPTLNWYADSLDVNKVYEFYMIPTGNKNPASTGTPVVIQGFKLINPPPEAVYPDTVYVTITDTVFIDRIDTVVVEKIDTVIIQEIDTLVLWDTLYYQPKYYFLPDSAEISVVE